MLPTDSDAALDARVQALSDDDLAALAADGCAAELARYRPHALLKRLVEEVQAGRGIGVAGVPFSELRKRVRCQHVLTEPEPDTDSEDYIRCLDCGKTGTVVPCGICSCHFCECCERGLR